MPDLAIAEAAASEGVKALATDIRAAQDPEITTMAGWLDEWKAAPTVVGGMDHGTGLMSEADMEMLRAAEGADFDRKRLTMMVEHHEGAIEMANDVMTTTTDPKVKALAQAVVTASRPRSRPRGDSSSPDSAARISAPHNVSRRTVRRVYRGVSSERMEFLTWGEGPRRLLYIGGGPGSTVPGGRSGRLRRRYFDPYVDAGYAVWVVTRPRHMSQGHGMTDIAQDYARFLDEWMEGRADLVLGESFGGMVAQHLAGLHPAAVGCLALVGSAHEVSGWGKEVDRRLAEAVSRGDHVAAGAAFAEYVLPSARAERLRRRVAPFMAKPLLTSADYPPGDVLVELEAEMACDCRPVLPGIEAPTLVIAGGRDRFFPKDIVDETVDLIKTCAVVRYPGKGHIRTCSSSRATRDVLAFVHREGTAA